MSHVVKARTGLISLKGLLKNLKQIGLEKISLEKKKLEKYFLDIHLLGRDWNEFLSFCWNGGGYHILSDTDLMSIFSKLNETFSKSYSTDLITKQSKRLSFRFDECDNIIQTDQKVLKISKYNLLKEGEKCLEENWS